MTVMHTNTPSKRIALGRPISLEVGDSMSRATMLDPSSRLSHWLTPAIRRFSIFASPAANATGHPSMTTQRKKTVAASRQWRPDGRLRRAGFTLVEAVISILLVGVTLVTAMNLAGLSGAGQIGAFQQRRGRMLARELLIEIQSQHYVDPDLLEGYWDSIVQTGSITLSGGDNFGPAVSEITGDRSLFDDVDDYSGWTASPPQDKDGTVRNELIGWTRTAVVEKVNPGDFSLLPSTDHGLRRITVSASYKGSVVATVTGFKSAGLPPLEACCECDKPCADLPVSICESRGGTPQGFGTMCSTDACYLARVAVVTKAPDNLTSLEQDRIAMLESLGASISTIADDDGQSAFTTLSATVDAFYVTQDANMGDVGAKLTGLAVGVLTENKDSHLELGFSDNVASVHASAIKLIDNSHYTTQSFSTTGVVQFSKTPKNMEMLDGSFGSGVTKIATDVDDPMKVALATLDAGAALFGGGTAAGRRVKLPWSSAFEMSNLNANGVTLLERSVSWAAGCESNAVCGDGECELGETTCTCAADCGAPTAIETVLVNCNDGLDNDCDGVTDCDDVNCALDGTCLLPSCGNLICEAGEDCNNCIDCPGVNTGPAILQYCCGDGVASTKEVNLGLCNGNY